MKEFIDKLESYLFDFLGLFIPGLVSVLMITIPAFLINYDKNFQDNHLQSWLLCLFLTFKDNLIHVNVFENTYIIIISVLIIYMIGHLIKVFSIIFYELMKALFDDFLYGKIREILQFLRRVSLINRMLNLQIIVILKKNISKIFSFKSESYMKENAPLKDNCEKILNEKLGITFPGVWYSLYKFSVVIILQEQLASLSFPFLSKYNLYRSLSFIYFLSFIYYFYFFITVRTFLTPESLKLESFILILISLLWFTFHNKYKRYWTLCGNEALVSLFYFLNKSKLDAR